MTLKKWTEFKTYSEIAKTVGIFALLYFLLGAVVSSTGVGSVFGIKYLSPK